MRTEVNADTRFSTVTLIFAAVISGYPEAAIAQAPPTDAPAEPDADSSAEAVDVAPASPESDTDRGPTAGPPPAAPDGAAPSKLEALEQRLSELESRAKADAQEIEALNERLDMQEESEIAAIADEEMSLSAYGFIDVQFSKFFIKKDTFYKDYLPDSTTFTLGHWNLFLRKMLNENFSVLGEVRFLFQPMGEESDWIGYEREEFSRFDTRATDVVDNHFFNWGAVSIQRAYIQYVLNDYFGVRAGYYLTPFGIWNEEHASPVILFAHRPFLNTAGHLPEAQLGLYLFGKIFAGNRLSFQYGLTVSNGRGPTSEVYDLDENKGLGLTLQASYDGPVFLNVGTYLYMGDYTDISREMRMPDVDFVKTTTVAYSEKAMSLHLKLKFKGLLIQGEYVRRLIEYDDTKRESSDHGIGILFSPDHVRSGSYEILAYTLPFDAVSITPYVLHEYKDMPTWAEYWAGHSFGGGINWRIIPSVVLKVEGLHNKHRKEEGVSSDFEILIVQLAASY